MEKINSKLWDNCSSNLTRFLLNRRKFVFFTRGGSKLFTPNHLVNCALNMAWYFRKMIWSNFATIIWEVLHKKPPFGHSKNGKWFFRPKKMKTSLGNIVCHSNMHPCAQYEIIWTNYAMNVAIRLIIWLGSQESSEMIAHFWEHFFKIIAVLQVCYFSWELGHI